MSQENVEILRRQVISPDSPDGDRHPKRRSGKRAPCQLRRIYDALKCSGRLTLSLAALSHCPRINAQTKETANAIKMSSAMSIIFHPSARRYSRCKRR